MTAGLWRMIHLMFWLCSSKNVRTINSHIQSTSAGSSHLISFILFIYGKLCLCFRSLYASQSWNVQCVLLHSLQSLPLDSTKMRFCVYLTFYWEQHPIRSSCSSILFYFTLSTKSSIYYILNIEQEHTNLEHQILWILALPWLFQWGYALWRDIVGGVWTNQGFWNIHCYSIF
jgi:hypothetical protein